jgi:hypothetical protein
MESAARRGRPEGMIDLLVQAAIEPVEEHRGDVNDAVRRAVVREPGTKS